ncbi:hypothetical protein PV326_006464 [Microctonus aethiopoides]|nr:hypothetical protein PV326_006464 [Microctonus aethiopoides]
MTQITPVEEIKLIVAHSIRQTFLVLPSHYHTSSLTFWESGLKWHSRARRYISDFKIPVQVWHWQDGSNDAKSLQGPPTKFVTSYLQPVVCEPPFLHIALRELFCLCVVKVQIFLTNKANQQNFK